MATTPITVRIDTDLLEYLKTRAEKEHRTLSNLIISILLDSKNCVFGMGYGTGIDEGVLNALPKKMEEGE